MLQQYYNGMYFKPYPKDVGTCVLLAGGEAKEFMDVFIDIGVKGVLLSYFYLRRKFQRDKETIERLKEEFSNFDYVLMDSGGFTLQKAVAENKLHVSIEDYTKEYYDFCLQMQGHVTAFGAVDCVSEEHDFYVEDMYESCYRAKELGIHIIPTVWATTSWDLVSRYNICENFDLVGLSGGRTNVQHGIRQFARLKKAGVKVHGYAMTGNKHFQNYKFFSVDSISWSAAQRFGITFDYKAGRLKTYSIERKVRARRALFPKAKDAGIDTRAVLLEEKLRQTRKTVPQAIHSEINKLNLLAWLKLDEEQRKNKRGAYWLGPPANLVEVEDADGY